jgi:hypothetical protein
MLVVDRILEIHPEGVKCAYLVPETSVFMDGDHLSEAGLIENAAQSASCIVARGYSTSGKAVIGFISAIRSVKIYHLPHQGASIVCTATLLSRFDGENYSTCRLQCRTFHGEMLLLEGEINLFIQEHEKGGSTTGRE